jgi:hypothetical protein
MRSWIVQSITAVLLAVAVGGCTHYEIPFLQGGQTRGGDKSTVDVNGVTDGVTSENVVIKRIPFPVDEYARLKTTGNSTVKGNIAITYQGHRIPGRQTRLYLNPVTSYSNQWYRESYLGGHKMGKSDPRLFNYLRFTTSNRNGAFAFYGVPAGEYYVVGTVRCDACGGKNIRIARRVRVNGSNTVTVDLSKSE